MRRVCVAPLAEISTVREECKTRERNKIGGLGCRRGIKCVEFVEPLLLKFRPQGRNVNKGGGAKSAGLGTPQKVGKVARKIPMIIPDPPASLRSASLVGLTGM